MQIYNLKEAEKKLVIQDERLQAFDKMSDGALFRLVRDISTETIKFDYVSGAWEKITGVSNEDTLADLQNVLKNIQQDDRQLMLLQISELKFDIPDRKFDFEIRYIYPATKKRRWLQILSYPHLESDCVIFDGFVFDITARKETEKELLVKNNRLETLSNNLPDGALYQFVLDTKTDQMSMSYAGGRWEEVTGVAADIAMSNMDTLYALVHFDDLPMVMQDIDNSARTMADFEVEFRGAVRGRTRWIKMSSRPRRDGTQIFWDGIITDITQRKETERELEIEKSRLQMLSDNIPGSALFQFARNVRTGQMRMRYVSARWETVTGVTAADVLIDISKLFDAIEPDDLPALMQTIDNSAMTMTDYPFETRMNGRWINIIARPRCEGAYIIWDGIITDITSYKDTERNLEAEKSRLQVLGDNLPNSTLYQFTRNVRTRQMRMLYVSATWETVTGIAAAAVMSKATEIFSAISLEDTSSLLQVFEESAKTMNDFDMEICFGNRWMNIIARPRRDNLHIIWDGIITDITERKKNEIELSRYREKLEDLVKERTEELNAANLANKYQLVVLGLLVEASGIGLWDMEVVKGDPVNPNNPFTWSDEFRKILGYSSETDFPDILSSWSDKLHPDDKKRTLDAFARHLLDRSGKTPYDVEYQLLRKNGEYGHFKAYGATVRDEEGYALRVAGALLDITEKKLADKALEQYRTQLEQMVEQRTAELTVAKEKAEESDRLKSAFLANISHEIRTPLNGIVGIAQLLDSEDLTDEDRKEYIGIVNNCTTQLINLIRDIVDISQIEANQLKLNTAPVQINKLMDELYLFYKAYLQTHNKGDIEFMLARSGVKGNHIVNVDPARLQQILGNLISNAVKFTENGHIRFGYRQLSPDKLEFFVEDTGIGLKPEHKEIIFERFRQVDPTNNRQYEGAGLGLSISRSLVEMMGGDLWIESAEGKGSSFYFTITINN